MRVLWETSKVKMGEESIELIKSRTQKVIKIVKKLVIRYVRTKWMASNKCCGKFFVHWSGKVH